MRERRESLAAVAGGEAAELAAAALPAALLRQASFVSTYIAMGSEIDPRPLARRFEAAGATLLLPVVVERSGALVFREAGADAPGAIDAAGLPAPGPLAPEHRPRLLIVPLLAFDAQGARIGYGGGYYDRTLAALRASGEVFALGLAFAGQEAPAVPREAHDQKLDAVVTELGYRAFR
jgi:5-formyltetrahydrofolate cyclo-ligase